MGTDENLESKIFKLAWIHGRNTLASISIAYETKQKEKKREIIPLPSPDVDVAEATDVLYDKASDFILEEFKGHRYHLIPDFKIQGGYFVDEDGVKNDQSRPFKDNEIKQLTEYIQRKLNKGSQKKDEDTSQTDTSTSSPWENPCW